MHSQTSDTSGAKSPSKHSADSSMCVLSHSDDTARKPLQTQQCADAQREVEILHEGRQIEEYMRQYAETGDFAARGAADRARLRMEALIRGRSAAVVARLEAERGLA